MGPRRREEQSASPHRADCPEPGLVPAVTTGTVTASNWPVPRRRLPPGDWPWDLVRTGRGTIARDVDVADETAVGVDGRTAGAGQCRMTARGPYWWRSGQASGS